MTHKFEKSGEQKSYSDPLSSWKIDLIAQSWGEHKIINIDNSNIIWIFD